MDKINVTTYPLMSCYATLLLIPVVFRLGVDDRSMDHFLAQSGCEVHCFDPGLEQPHLQKAEMWFHRISVDWRDPSPGIAPKRQASNKKLSTIMDEFGHRDVSGKSTQSCIYLSTSLYHIRLCAAHR